ncbi:MAG: hypothetical protein Q9171_002930 [Xanthocarpia ochracea]
MPFCEHLQWIQYTHGDDRSLIEPGRLQRINQDLAHPHTQYPSVVFFVGQKARDVAVRQLFPWNNLQRSSKQAGLATLRAETISLQSDFPLFFAESNPFMTATTPLENDQLCHEVRPYPLLWPDEAVDNLYNLTHARLLFLFTDVLCVFADDFLDMDSMLHQLRSWAALGWASRLLATVRPKVIVVRKGVEPSPSPLYDLLDQQDLRFNIKHQDLIRYFSSVTVLQLAHEQISPSARHRRLKELMQRQVEEMRHLKQAYGCLYSAVHLNDFFVDAVRHTARSITKPFDFLSSSRRGSHSFTEYTDHLSSFLKIAAVSRLSSHDTTNLIASTILLDAYPSGRHRFDPMVVFTHLYQAPCLRSYETSSYNVPTSEERTLSIRTYLTDLFADMQSSGRSAAETFGEPQTDVDYRYVVDECPMCAAGTMSVVLKPPTAGIRILSIDGGGVRGAVPLEFLGLLQDVLGDDCPIQDLFDLAFGTSSGGLIILSLFVRQWGVQQCCWLSDGIYDVKALEKVLKDVFGTYERMFGTVQVNQRTKIAVTATTISNASPFVFSNYNGIGVRGDDCGGLSRPVLTEDEPYIWEAGRATSAAPMLFRPIRISSLGTFQDGGLKHNNPVNLALWESRYRDWIQYYISRGS